jgi:ubiquitin carboxyl-terminal hydrolase 7
VKPLGDLKRRHLFLQIHPRVSGPAPFFPEHRPEEALIFVKFYDPGKCEMEYVGSWVFNARARKLNELRRYVIAAKGLAATTELLYFEEVRPSMVNLLSPYKTFTEEELSNGDIVICQPVVKIGAYTTNAYCLVDKFCDYLHHRLMVSFSRLDRNREAEEPFEINLSTKMTYDQVTARLGDRIGVDPLHLRLTQHIQWKGGPNDVPMKRTPSWTLAEMLGGGYANVLYYEVLDFSIVELEHKTQMRVTWQNSHTHLMDTYSVLLPNEATVADLLSKLATMVPLEKGLSGQIRLLEISGGYRIDKIPAPTVPIVQVGSQWTVLRAEEMTVEEAATPVPGDRLVKVLHYSSLEETPFGVPFVVLIRGTDTVATLRAKIQKKLNVPDEAFQTWRLAIYSMLSRRLEYLTPEHGPATSWEWDGTRGDQLALEHKPTAAARNHAMYARRVQKAIKISG